MNDNTVPPIDTDARIVGYWRTKSPASKTEPNSSPENTLRALIEEVDSATHFYPDEPRSFEALGRFISAHRSQVCFIRDPFKQT